MRVLVTGGAGFIGSHVVDLLLTEGHQVGVVDDLSTGRRQQVSPQSQFFQGDLRQDGSLDWIRRFRPQTLVHHAAQASVSRSVAAPAHDAAVNIVGLLRVVEAARPGGLERIIFASTGGALYGAVDRPVREDAPKRPVAPYGIAKLTAERYLEYYERQAGLSCLSLRYSNVYGPRQNPHGEAGVVAIFSRQMLAGTRPTIYGDGQQTRDYVYVGDVARANLLAVAGDATGALNIGTGRATRLSQLYRRLAEAASFRAEPRFGPERPGDLRHSQLDASRARRVLAWEPDVSLDDGLERTMTWYRRRYREG